MPQENKTNNSEFISNLPQIEEDPNEFVKELPLDNPDVFKQVELEPDDQEQELFVKDLPLAKPEPLFTTKSSSTSYGFDKLKFMRNVVKQELELQDEELPENYDALEFTYNTLTAFKQSKVNKSDAYNFVKKGVKEAIKLTKDYETNLKLRDKIAISEFYRMMGIQRDPNEITETEVNIIRPMILLGYRAVDKFLFDVPTGLLKVLDEDSYNEFFTPRNTAEEVSSAIGGLGGFIAGPVKAASKILDKPMSKIFERITAKYSSKIAPKLAQIVAESLTLGSAEFLSRGNDQFIKAITEDKKLDAIAEGTRQKLIGALEGSLVFGARYAAIREFVADSHVWRALFNVALTNAYTKATDPQASLGTYVTNTLMDVYFAAHGATVDYKTKKLLEEYINKIVSKEINRVVKSKGQIDVFNLPRDTKGLERLVKEARVKIDYTDVKRRFVKDWSRLYMSGKNELPTFPGANELHEALKRYRDLNIEFNNIKAKKRGIDPESKQAALDALKIEMKNIENFVRSETKAELSFGRGGVKLYEPIPIEKITDRKLKMQRKVQIAKTLKEIDEVGSRVGQDMTLDEARAHKTALKAKLFQQMQDYIQEFYAEASESQINRALEQLMTLRGKKVYEKALEKQEAMEVILEDIKQKTSVANTQRAAEEVIGALTKTPFDALDMNLVESLTKEEIEKLPDRIKRRILRASPDTKDITSFQRWFTTKEFWAAKYGDPEVLNLVSEAIDAKNMYNFVVGSRKALAFETEGTLKFLNDLYEPLTAKEQNNVRLALKRMEDLSKKIKLGKNQKLSRELLKQQILDEFGLNERERAAFEGTRIYFDQMREKIIDHFIKMALKRNPSYKEAQAELDRRLVEESVNIKTKRTSAQAIANEVAEKYGVDASELYKLQKRIGTIRRWGVNDFVTRMEIGNFVVIRPDGHVESVFKDYQSAERYAEQKGRGYRVIVEDYINIDPLKPRSSEASLEGEYEFFKALQEYARRVHKRLILDPVIEDLNQFISTKRLPRNVYEGLRELRNNLKGYQAELDRRIEAFLTRKRRLPYGTASSILRSVRTVEAALKLGWRVDAALVNLYYGHAHTIAKVGFKTWFDAAKWLKTPEGERFLREEEPYFGIGFVMGEEGAVRDRLPNWHPLKMFSLPEHNIRAVSTAANYIALKRFYAKEIASGKMTELDIRRAARRATRFQAFTYDVAALPEIYAKGGEIGKTVLQFKSYLIQELQFLSTLSPGEAARYVGLNMVVGGYRAYMATLKSLPFLVLAGIPQKIDLWLTTKLKKEEITEGVTVEDALSGIPGLLGMDMSAAASIQFPTGGWEDWLGPALKDFMVSMKKIGYIYETDKNLLWSRTIFDEENPDIPPMWKPLKVLDEISDFFILGRRIADAAEAVTMTDNVGGVIYVRDRKTGQLKYPITIDPMYTAMITVFSGSTKKRKDLRNALNMAFELDKKYRSERNKLRQNVIKLMVENKPIPDHLIKKAIDLGYVNFADEVAKLSKLPPHRRVQAFMSIYEKMQAEEIFKAYRLDDNKEPLIKNFFDNLDKLLEDNR